MPEPREDLDRRAFLSHAALLGAAAAGGMHLTGGLAEPAEGHRRREHVRAGAPRSPFELEEITVAGLQEGMSSGRYTSRKVVELYLARIAAMDRTGVSLHAIIETNPDALARADELDRERAATGPRGPLHGIPVLLKDNIDTADRMTTTAGSLALEGSIPPRDSHVAERLRAAGAVLLAKANMSEWANIRSNRSSSGWSARGGQCRNPYVLDRNPCGSSSGSAAAVSANFGAVAVGTETDGSIVCPASANGVVGIKPTVGLVSRAGVIPIAHSQDTAGPMARTVRDAAILLGVLAGADPDDPPTTAGNAKRPTDYTTFLDPKGLEGARIGVARKGFFGQSGAADRLAEAAIEVMRKLGAIVVDPADIATYGQFEKSELEVLLYEFKADLNAYLSALGPRAPVHSLEEAIAFNERHKDREMPFFGQEIFLDAQKKGPLASREYRVALERNHRLSRVLGIDQTLAGHRLDALVAPTGAPPSLTDLVNGDYGTAGSSTLPAVAGYPHITVPMGYVFGLPVGLSFFGGAWSEPTLIRLAYAFEQATHHRKAPGYLKTADLTRP